MLTGPDCSWHQGTVNWSAVRAAGHDFAIIKATEGTHYSHVDWFEHNWPQVHASGLVPGAYHFLSAGASATAQADYYVNTVGDFAGVLAAVDVETNANGGHPSSAQAHEFAARFHQRVPGHPIFVYTGRWYWHDILGNPYGADIGPLWHSAYSANPGALYGGWPKFTTWQNTSSAAVPGVSGGCDLSQFYGDMNDMLALTGTTPEVPLQLDAEDQKFIKDTIADAARKNANFLTGHTNTMFDPNYTAPDGSHPNEWMKTAVTTNDLVIDVEALAAALGPLLPPVSQIAIEEALREVLPEIRITLA